jgi:hypothetical protein
MDAHEMADALTKILAELIVLSVFNWFPMRRMKSIERTLKGMRRDLHRGRRWTAGGFARHRRRLDDHERRLDRHDEHAAIDTKRGDPTSATEPP